MKILRSKGKQSPPILPIFEDKDPIDYIWVCPNCGAIGTYYNPIVFFKDVESELRYGWGAIVICANCKWEGDVKTAVVTGGFKIDVTVESKDENNKRK